MALNVSHWDQCDALVEQVYDAFGRCDVLVNNAGLSPLYESLPAVTEELYDKTHAVNAKGPFRLASLIGSRMYEGDGGSIINVSTAGSWRPDHNDLPYAMAKAGLNALTLGLAGAWNPKVRANTVLPGPYDTDITKAWAPGTIERGRGRRARCAGWANRPTWSACACSSRATPAVRERGADPHGRGDVPHPLTADSGAARAASYGVIATRATGSAGA